MNSTNVSNHLRCVHPKGKIPTAVGFSLLPTQLVGCTGDCSLHGGESLLELHTPLLCGSPSDHTSPFWTAELNLNRQKISVLVNQQL